MSISKQPRHNICIEFTFKVGGPSEDEAMAIIVLMKKDLARLGYDKSWTGPCGGMRTRSAWFKLPKQFVEPARDWLTRKGFVLLN